MERGNVRRRRIPRGGMRIDHLRGGTKGRRRGRVVSGKNRIGIDALVGDGRRA